MGKYEVNALNELVLLVTVIPLNYKPSHHTVTSTELTFHEQLDLLYTKSPFAVV